MTRREEILKLLDTILEYRLPVAVELMIKRIKELF